MINPTNGQSAASVSLNGVNRAQQQFANAAVDVINAYSAAANNISGAAPGTSGVDTQVLSAIEASSPETSMVNMLMASNAYKANLKMLKGNLELTKHAIDILG